MDRRLGDCGGTRSPSALAGRTGVAMLPPDSGAEWTRRRRRCRRRRGREPRPAATRLW